SLILASFQDNLLYYVTPSEAIENIEDDQSKFRVGGLVEVGSFKRSEGSLKSRFILTDGFESIEVNYTGILPDLFREGQGIIVTGSFNTMKVFIASEVLAKHDENYMPPDIHPMNESSS
ncbi:MAG: cytochrome c maturation protein CcmE, partial [Pseudomonadota bacterium]|nr:cytochrome c maturation protein CcmE [Pseudomonadota bacterium]